MVPATDRNLRFFGFLMAVFLLLVWRLVSVKFEIGPDHRAWLFPLVCAISAGFALVGGFAPRALTFIYKPWMVMAHYLGLVMTTVLMTLFFFTLLVPFTLIKRRDPLRLKLGSKSYWEPHKNPEPTIERFRRAF